MIPRFPSGSLCTSLMLVLLSVSSPPALAQDHSGHSDQAAAQQKPGGDPYLLDVDAVSGKRLGSVDKQVIVLHESREFRFASQQNADAFKAAPEKYVPGVDAKLIAQQTPFYPMETSVVSGDELGKKDAAFDFVYQNRLVRLANKDEMAGFLKEPAKYVAKLDAAVIERQMPKYKTTSCVVSGKKLGDMGDPIDRVVGNRLVRFCCKGCLKTFDKDPLTYLAKLDGGGKEKAGKGGALMAGSYDCPMHADVVKDGPGTCPKCGMDLVKKK